MPTLPSPSSRPFLHARPTHRPATSPRPTGRLAARLAVALVVALFTTPLAAQFVPDVVSYLGVSASSHQIQWNSLTTQGYRPISLSVAGNRTSPNYTAVWIRRSGAAFSGIHGVDRATYLAWSANQRSAGLRPLLLSAAGPTGNEVFAGVYVADGKNAVEDTDLLNFASRTTWARDNGYVQTCAGAYGSRYCGIWEETPIRTNSTYAYSSAADYAADFDARASAHQRQSFVLPLSSGYGQVWRDDVVGGWECVPGLTLTQMQAAISSRRPSGAYPVCLQQRDTGAAARWSAIFASRDLVPARTLTRTGLTSLPLAGFDTLLEDHMRTHGIRSSAIAITKHGRLVHARGFTLAEPGAAATQPTSMFRIASCTKVLTGLMTNLLVQQGGTITRNTGVSTYLGLGPIDSRFQQITVQHLLQHRSGVVNDMNSYSITSWLNPTTRPLPVSSWSNALYAAGHWLAFSPGAHAQYSNTGYYLLGEVITRASGKSYERYLRENLAAPHDVSRMWVSQSLVGLRLPGEVDYHNRDLELTPSSVHTDRRVMPIQYGGEGDDNLLRRAAAGGVITSPVDYVRVLSGALDLGRDGGLFTQATIDTMLAAPSAGSTTIAGFDQRTVRPNGVVSWSKNGMLWGSSAQFVYRSDGVAIAVFDGQSGNPVSVAALDAAADAVTSWPTFDLFPNHGLPSFVRRSPRIDAVSHTVLPNVTDTVLVIDGELLAGVDRVSIGNTQVTSLLSWNPVNGWLRRVSDRQLEIHVPQGMTPGAYDVVLHDGIWSSRSFPLTIVRALSRTLVGPTSTPTAYDLVASRGFSPPASLAYLAVSGSAAPTVVPGIVSFGIGNGFADLTILGPMPFDAATGAARIPIPDLGNVLAHFQVAILDPTTATPFPVPVTNVRSVQGW